MTNQQLATLRYPAPCHIACMCVCVSVCVCVCVYIYIYLLAWCWPMYEVETSCQTVNDGKECVVCYSKCRCTLSTFIIKFRTGIIQCEWLDTGWSTMGTGFDYWQRLIQNVQTGSGAHQFSYSLILEVLSLWVKQSASEDDHTFPPNPCLNNDSLPNMP